MSSNFRKFPIREIITPNDLSQALEYLLRVLPEGPEERLSPEIQEERMRVMAMIQIYRNKDVLDRLLGELGILPSE